ncbi:MAG: MFS transporter, partial [Fimbriimonadaceae bacterium]|nr:MFS transporter [Alphaproteobacteria bacterium]
ELALMGAIMGIVPSTAPFIGGFIHQFFGWRATFSSQTLLCLITIAIVFLALPETLRERHPERLTLRSFPSIYSGLMAESAYRTYVAILTLTYAGLFSFISASSFVLQGVYGWSEIAFGLAFGICSLSYITGTFTGTRSVKARGLATSVRIGTALLCLGGLAMVTLMASGLDNPYALVAAMMVYMIGVGIALPQSVAAALTFYPDRAGAASSFLGFAQMAVGALAGIIVGHAFNGSAWPLAIALAVAGTLALLLAILRRDIAEPS